MILEAHDLVKTYSRQGKTFEAVSHVSLSAGKGDVLVLTGPSGCGKSTLFHMLSGIITRFALFSFIFLFTPVHGNCAV